MGQTLTHGVYLPDEGERNCYNGLAANWSILDGAVGTIAEHTSALSGKAPLVHTHSKADITDLFNSANTWTGDNTFSKTVAIERSTDTGNFLALKNTVAELGSTPAKAAPVTIAYRDKNDENLGYMGVYYDTDGSNHFRIYVRNKFTSGVPSTSGTVDYAYFGLKINADKSKEGILKASFRPYDNNTYDLGSSSYQWNNLYAKNYYYNGVAWGLDKANTWTQNQVIASSNDKCYFVKDTIYELGQDYPNGEHLGGLTIHDKNGATVGLLDIVDRSYGNMEMRIRVQQKFDPNSNNRSTSGNTLFNEIILGITPTKTNYIGFNADLWGNNTYNLGTASSKWKTLNGINPGALSLPGNYASRITLDLTNWVFDGSVANAYTPSSDGWLNVRIDDVDGAYILVFQEYRVQTMCGTGALINYAWGLSLLVPVRAGIEVTLRIDVKTGTRKVIYFYPCLGNV